MHPAPLVVTTRGHPDTGYATENIHYGPARFGLTQGELALLCASHSGEDKHLAGVQSILGKIGLDA